MSRLWEHETVDELSAEGTSLLEALRKAAAAVEFAGEEVTDDLKMMIDLAEQSAERARRDDEIRMAGVIAGYKAVDDMAKASKTAAKATREVIESIAKVESATQADDDGGVWL